MPSKPPVEKLPLAVRKSFRDDFDARKPEFEKALSEILGVAWTIEINPNELFAYAAESSDSELKSRTGYAVAKYFSAAVDKLKEFQKQYEGFGIDEVNRLASAHVMTLAQSDDTNYASCDIADGRLRITFKDAQFGSWYSGALGDLGAACDAASAVDGPYTFLARSSVQREYEPHAEAVRADIAATLAIPDVTLNPRLEANADAMTRAGVRSWKEDWGRMLLKNVRDAAEGLKNAGFKGDDMMQEAIQEALTAKELAIHVDQEAAKGQWNCVALEDGAIRLQYQPQYYNTTITGNMSKLVDLL